MRWTRGHWVEVKEASAIAATLDANGTLDGLPFMPEMLAYCGKRFRIARRVWKSCVEFADGYRIMEWIDDDVVLLEGMRCSGGDHDGCQRGCLIFWRTAWLRPAREPDETGAAPPPNEVELAAVRAKLKTRNGPERYFCQSTEVASLVHPQSRGRILARCLRDVLTGNRGVWEMARLIIVPAWRKFRLRFGRYALVGSLRKTPSATLDLQRGDWVELKPAEQICETLDPQGRNRGLLVDSNAVRQYGGGCYRVRTRVQKMIHEATGRMCTLDNTVVLEGVECPCYSVIGGCPREDPVFWREIWLKRPNAPAEIKG